MTTNLEQALSSFWRQRRSKDRAIELRDLQEQLTNLAQLVTGRSNVNIVWSKDIAKANVYGEDIVLDASALQNLRQDETVPDNIVDNLFGDVLYRSYLTKSRDEGKFDTALQHWTYAVNGAYDQYAPDNETSIIEYDYSRRRAREIRVANPLYGLDKDQVSRVPIQRVRDVIDHVTALTQAMDAPPAVRQYVDKSRDWKREAAAPLINGLVERCKGEQVTIKDALDLFGTWLTYGIQIPAGEINSDLRNALLTSGAEISRLVGQDQVAVQDVLSVLRKVSESFSVFPDFIPPPPEPEPIPQPEQDSDEQEDSEESGGSGTENPQPGDSDEESENDPQEGEGEDQAPAGDNDDLEDEDTDDGAIHEDGELDGEESEDDETPSDDQDSSDDSSDTEDDQDDSEDGTEGESESPESTETTEESDTESGEGEETEQDSDGDSEDELESPDDNLSPQETDEDDEYESGLESGDSPDDEDSLDEDTLDALEQSAKNSSVLDSLDLISELSQDTIDEIKETIEKAKEDITDEINLLGGRGYGSTFWEKGVYDAHKEQELLTEGYKQATGISSVLRRFARMRSRYEHGRPEGSKLDKRRLYRVSTGNLSVFEKRTIIDKLDMSLTLLADASSSIKDPQWNMMMEVIAGFVQALRGRDDVQLMACAYTTDMLRNRTGMLSEGGTYMTRIWDRGMGKLNTVREHKGGTPSDVGFAAVRDSIYGHLKVTKKDRIIIHLTDGAPGDKVMTAAQVKLCEDQGIEVYCILICDEYDLRENALHFETAYKSGHFKHLESFDRLLPVLTELFEKITEVR